MKVVDKRPVKVEHVVTWGDVVRVGKRFYMIIRINVNKRDTGFNAIVIGIAPGDSPDWIGDRWSDDKESPQKVLDQLTNVCTDWQVIPYDQLTLVIGGEISEDYRQS